MHIHKWSKWKEIERYQITQKGYDGKDSVVGKILLQERECETCNKKELDKNIINF